MPHEEYPSRATRRLYAGMTSIFVADGDAADAASPVTVAAAADIGAWGRLTIRTLRSRLSTVYP